MTDFSTDDKDDSIEFLPPLELLVPAPEDCVIIRAHGQPMHVPSADAVETGRIKGVESAEVLVMNANETEAEQWLIFYLFTVDDAIDSWDTHLANIRANSSIPRHAPPFSLERISAIRNGAAPYALEEVQWEESWDQLPPQALSPAAEILWNQLREMDRNFDEELNQYDQGFVLLLPDAIITTDSVRRALRDVIEQHLPDVAMHGPVLDDYAVPEGFAEIQLRFMTAEGKAYMAETREEYLKYAAMRDVIWIEEMAPAMAALNATRLLDDKEEREWREEDEERYQDDILLERTPLPSVLFQQTLDESSSESDPAVKAASEEFRVPLEDPAGLLLDLESQRAYADDIPELMLEQTIEALRAQLRSAQR